MIPALYFIFGQISEEEFLSPSSGAQKGKNFFQVWLVTPSFSPLSYSSGVFTFLQEGIVQRFWNYAWVQKK